MKKISSVFILAAMFSAMLISCRDPDTEINEQSMQKNTPDISENDVFTETSEVSYNKTDFLITEITPENIFTVSELEKFTETDPEISSVSRAVVLSVSENAAAETQKSDGDISSTMTEAPHEVTEPVTTVRRISSEDMLFTVNDTEVSIGKSAEELILALGKPESTETAKGYFGDKDAKIYNYDEITLYTYLEDGNELICDIEIKDRSFSTKKGLSAGMRVSDAEKLYGKGERTGDIIFYYSSESEYMYLFVSKDTIISIGYAKDLQ